MFPHGKSSKFHYPTPKLTSRPRPPWPIWPNVRPFSCRPPSSSGTAPAAAQIAGPWRSCGRWQRRRVRSQQLGAWWKWRRSKRICTVWLGRWGQRCFRRYGWGFKWFKYTCRYIWEREGKRKFKCIIWYYNICVKKNKAYIHSHIFIYNLDIIHINLFLLYIYIFIYTVCPIACVLVHVFFAEFICKGFMGKTLCMGIQLRTLSASVQNDSGTPSHQI